MQRMSPLPSMFNNTLFSKFLQQPHASPRGFPTFFEVGLPHDPRRLLFSHGPAARYRSLVTPMVQTVVTSLLAP